MALIDSPTIPQYSSLDLQGVNTIRSAAPPEESGDLFRLGDFWAGKAALEAYANNVALAVKNELQNQIQSFEQGMLLKPSARTASVSNVPLSSINPLISGVQTATNDRIALVGQTDPRENGLYVCTASGLVRAEDANSSAELQPSTAFRVNEGTLAGHLFYLDNDTAPNVGTDNISFVDQTPALALAGLGLTYDPATNSYNVGGTSGRIIISADSIDIAPEFEQHFQDTLTAATSSLNQRVTSLEGRDYVDDTELASALSDATSPLSSRISSIENAGYQTAAQVQSRVNTSVGPIDTRLTTIENAGYQTAAQVQTSVDTATSSLNNRVSSIESAGYQTSSQVDNRVSNALTPIDARLSTVESDIPALDGRVSTIENAGYQNSVQVDNKINSALTPFDARVTTVEGEVSSLDGRISTVENAGYQKAPQVQSAINTALTPLDIRITTVEGETSNLDGRVSTLENAGYQKAPQVQSAISSALAPVDTRITAIEDANYQTAPQVNTAIDNKLAPVNTRVTSIENANYQNLTQVQSTVGSAIAPVDARLQTVESAGYQNSTQVSTAITDAQRAFVNSTELAVTLQNGVISTSGITKTYTVDHTLNSRDIALLGVRNLSTGTTVTPGTYTVVSPTRVQLTFTSSSLPADGSLRILLKKIGV